MGVTQKSWMIPCFDELYSKMVRTVIGDLRVLYLPGMVGELNHVPIECSLEFDSTPEFLIPPRQDDLVVFLHTSTSTSLLPL